MKNPAQVSSASGCGPVSVNSFAVCVVFRTSEGGYLPCPRAVEATCFLHLDEEVRALGLPQGFHPSLLLHTNPILRVVNLAASLTCPPFIYRGPGKGISDSLNKHGGIPQPAWR